MRQTGLSFEELTHFAQNPQKSPYPLCLIINEIGELALIDDMRAAKERVDFLENPDANVRYAASCWIKECSVLAGLWPLRELLPSEINPKVKIAMENAINKLEHITGWKQS